MTSTTSLHPIPTASISEHDLTAAELRELADLLDLQGQIVARMSGTVVGSIGTLTQAYVTDGVACNVHGLIDWAAEGRSYGRDFSMGPLYGQTVVPVPDPWVGYDYEGLALEVYVDEVAACDAVGTLVENADRSRRVCYVGPYSAFPRKGE